MCNTSHVEGPGGNFKLQQADQRHLFETITVQFQISDVVVVVVTIRVMKSRQTIGNTFHMQKRQRQRA
jgi:hypothetical protein